MLLGCDVVVGGVGVGFVVGDVVVDCVGSIVGWVG